MSGWTIWAVCFVLMLLLYVLIVRELWNGMKRPPTPRKREVRRTRSQRGWIHHRNKRK